jgi:hypothetical protein
MPTLTRTQLSTHSARAQHELHRYAAAHLDAQQATLERSRSDLARARTRVAAADRACEAAARALRRREARLGDVRAERRRVLDVLEGRAVDGKEVVHGAALPLSSASLSSAAAGSTSMFGRSGTDAAAAFKDGKQDHGAANDENGENDENANWANRSVRPSRGEHSARRSGAAGDGPADGDESHSLGLPAWFGVFTRASHPISAARVRSEMRLAAAHQLMLEVCI